MPLVILGGTLPITYQLSDYSTDKFVRAYVRDANGDAIAGSPVDLEHVANGLYESDELVMPLTPFVRCQYVVFDDSGYTVRSTSEGGGVDVFDRDTGGGGSSASNDSGLVGVLESDLENPVNGIQDEIVKGSARTLNVRLVRNDNGDPFNIDDATAIVARFLNTDETVLEISLADGDIAVVSGPAGKLTVALTAEQTTDLMEGTPRPFAIRVTLPIGVIICNFPYQLQISDEAV